MEAAMLDRAHRLRRRTDFAAAIRQGRRAGRGTVAVHLYRARQPGHPAQDRTATDQTSSGPGVPPRAGFIVPRTVGGAVVRNTVRRRLQHLVREHLAVLPPGSMLVIRALPAAAGAPSARLGADLAAALRAVARTPHSPARKEPAMPASATARLREPVP
jgi:ribonuclease P protein component